MKSIFAAAAAFCLAGCSTLDLSDSSCGLSEGVCLDQCRSGAGAGQMACEDQCRAEADMCRARER